MRLEFQKYGHSGEPVVVLHGLLGSHENWQTVCLRLAEHFEVFALDQRNHGRSPHSDRMTYADLAGDVAEFIDTRLSAVPHLLGHSMGGKAAMQLALGYPGKVKSLIVADIGPGAYSLLHLGVIEALLALDLPVYRTRREIEDALAPAIPALATRRFLLKNLVHDPHKSHFVWRIGLREIAANYMDLAGALTAQSAYHGPCVFLKGERSDYLDAAQLPDIRRHFPLTEIWTVPAAGHWVQADNPDAVVRLTMRFLHRQVQEKKGR